MTELWIAISIAVMLEPTGEMKIRSVPNKITSYEECMVWKQDLESLPMPATDPVSHLPMIARVYNCDPAP